MSKEPEFPEVIKALALDTSYTRTGIAVAKRGLLKDVDSIDFKGLKTWSEKRTRVMLSTDSWIRRWRPDIVIVERTRQFSAGFMSMNAIKAQITMTAVVVDAAFDYGIPVYSVDTRSWKAQIVGTTKPKNGDKKLPTMEFVASLGWDDINDDAADAACMALYPFLPKDQRKLKLEK